MFESMPAWIGLFVGLFIQGPGYWLMSWLESCAEANAWKRLPFDPKYIATWGLSIFAVAIALFVIPGQMEMLLSANWYGAVALGMAGQSLIGKVKETVVKYFRRGR